VTALPQDAISAPPRAVFLLRQHAVFAGVLTAGLLLRIAVMIAYPQAFFYTDSYMYIRSSYGWRPDFLRQTGYPMVLKVFRHIDQLWLVSGVQHLLGLLMAVAVYLLLVRHSVPRWLAAAATAPLLLDAFQLTIEHFLLAETIFTTLIVAGLVALLWPARITPIWAGAAGLLLATSVTFRVVSLPLVGVTVGYLLVRRTGWRPIVAYIACASAPIAGYQVWFHDTYHKFGFTTVQGIWLYGRVAPVADCALLDLTEAERKLCPRQPVGQRPPRADWYIFNPQSPAVDVDIDVQQSFALKVFKQQPATMAWVITKDVALFLLPNKIHPEWVCTTTGLLLPAEVPPPTGYAWCQPNPRQDFVGEPNPATAPHTTQLTRLLGAFAKYAQTPHLVLGLSVLLGLAAMVWRPRRRTAVSVSALMLLGGWGLGLIVLATLGSMYDVRYGLPSLPLLPALGALAAHRLWLLGRHPMTEPAPDVLTDRAPTATGGRQPRGEAPSRGVARS
jgi:hypothetical protein